MSTWGIGAFDNDDAAQWVAKFDAAPSSERVNVVRNALRGVLEHDHTDQEFAAVAAATAVASSLPGGPLLAPDYGPNRHLIEQFRAPDDLPELAIRALERVKGPQSQWSGLWYRAGSLDDAVAVIDAIIDELELRTALPDYVALSA
ncbi:DUF4259 domain-containing protein [Williamsia soli]|uniref:DUF4259 domain-containing protein n=1 Tax=Williamsia soli TaxID=364929 RepID=UPI001A9ECE7D|nr:DUF4259 domain-containing protein [Williamsia soli]